MKNIIECIKSGNVGYRGDNTKRFEQILSDYTGAYCVCTNTGTAALHLACIITNIQYQTILVPSITYIASVNAITYNYGVPHFVDSKGSDLNIDTEKLEKYLESINTNHIYAIMPVHVLGNPCDMDHIKEIAKKYNLKIIEDASQALGSWHNGEHCGTIGDIGTLSFNSNKIITTGGGGAILTKNKRYRDQALHLSTQARLDCDRAIHSEIGYNYRMPALNASLGLDQWERKKEFFENNKKLSKEKHMIANNWKSKTHIIDYIHKQDDPIWQPIHLSEPYKMYDTMPDMSGAEWIGENVRISK